MGLLSKLKSKNNGEENVEVKNCAQCQNYDAQTTTCSKYNKTIEDANSSEGENCPDWEKPKSGWQKFKEGYKEGKLNAIQKDASKRCGHCDHYIDGTRMCKKHNKKILRAYGPEGEFCENWTDFKQQMKKSMR